MLVYRVDITETTKAELARRVLTALADSGSAIISGQILNEFYNAATTKLRYPLTPIAAMEALLNLMSAWPAVDLVPGASIGAARAVLQHQLSYWDALLWATAKLNDVDVILTEDMQDGRVIEGVRIVNPLVDDFDLELLGA